jgi:4-aminobutyrate aminotransferase
VAAGSLTTSGTKFRSGFSPLMAGVYVSPFPDPGHFGWPVEQATEFALAQLDYVLHTLSAPADTAAFFVEPVLGEGGYVPANQRFLDGLRERADTHGMLLVLDEVQTGFGRTGKFWGGDHFNALPDILVTAKGLASGFPLSGIAAPSALMEKAWPRLAGRHLRRQRGGLRRRTGDARCDPRRAPGRQLRRARCPAETSTANRRGQA